MDGRTFYFLLTAAILCSVSVGQEAEVMNVKISVDISRSMAHEGDNITMTCRVHDLGKDFIYIFKHIEHPERKLHDLISTGDVLLPLYNQLGRYKVIMAEAGGTTLFIMDISGVKPEDSGHIGCSLGEYEQNIYDMTELQVYQNPTSINFENYTDDSSIMTKAGDPTPVTCHVKDSIPIPEVTIEVDNHDVTSDFHSHLEMNIYCDDGLTGMLCPLYNTHDVITSERADGFVASYKDHRKNVTCSAELIGSRLPKVSYALPLLVEYSPQFECPNEAYATEGEHDGRITCIVTAYPHDDNSTYKWTFMEGDSEMSLKVSAKGYGERVGNYYSGSERMNEDDVAVTLVVAEVYADSFKEYTLSASNDLGDNDITITLKPSMSQEETGAAGHVHHAVVNIIMSLFTFIFLCACAH